MVCVIHFYIKLMIKLIWVLLESEKCKLRSSDHLSKSFTVFNLSLNNYFRFSTCANFSFCWWSIGSFQNKEDRNKFIKIVRYYRTYTRAYIFSSISQFYIIYKHKTLGSWSLLTLSSVPWRIINSYSGLIHLCRL